MSDVDLDRVREDLALMKQAVGLRQPRERDELWASLALAGVGAIILAITACIGGADASVVRGSPEHFARVAAIVLPGIIAVAILTVLSYLRRGRAPLFWRENRQSVNIVAITAPLYIGFAVWAVRRGVSAGAISVATLFLFGLFLLISALTDRNRWYWFGWAVATMAAGACAPLMSHATAGFVCGGWILSGGLSTAALIAWELRHGGSPDGRRL